MIGAETGIETIAARPRYDFEPLYERAREGEIQVWDILVLAWDILVFETADDGGE